MSERLIGHFVEMPLCGLSAFFASSALSSERRTCRKILGLRAMPALASWRSCQSRLHRREVGGGPWVNGRSGLAVSLGPTDTGSVEALLLVPEPHL